MAYKVLHCETLIPFLLQIFTLLYSTWPFLSTKKSLYSTLCTLPFSPIQVWARFGHTIWHRSFRRVLCLYAYGSPLAFFFCQPFVACSWPIFNFPLSFFLMRVCVALGNQWIIIANLFHNVQNDTSKRVLDNFLTFLYEFFLVMLPHNVLLFFGRFNPIVRFISSILWNLQFNFFILFWLIRVS